MLRYNPTEQIGVNAVQQIVLNDLKWIFREQPLVDMGIDAHIELVAGNPTGRLIGVQIKTGPSHFTEKGNSYIYRGKNEHLEYWTNHSLPVILVGHIIEKKETFWVFIDKEKIKKTGKSWTIEIPKTNILNANSKDELTEVFRGTPNQQRLRRLAIDESLIRHVRSGGKVSVEIEKWINKGLGRSNIQVFIYNKSGEEILNKEWYQYYIGHSMKKVVEAIFPWAIAILDKEFFEENNDHEEEPWEKISRIGDQEHGLNSMPIFPDEIPAYSSSNGEVESYRIQLKLNKIGKAYLLLMDGKAI